jgi:hypothetical protein
MYENILRRLVGDDYRMSGDEAILLCPVHEQITGKPDHKPSFYFNVESGLCLCFSCGYKGNAYTLWRDIKGEDLEVDDEVPEDEWTSSMIKRINKIQVTAFTIPTLMDESDLESFQPPTEEMLESRKISAQAAAELGILSHSGAWVIPIRHSASNLLMGMQIKDGPLVRNLPGKDPVTGEGGVKKGLSLFGLNVARLPGDETLIVESPLDVAVLRTVRINAVATYGSTLTDEQVRHLMSVPGPVLAFDNDKAGKKASGQLAEAMLSQFIEVYAINWPDDMKDPGDDPDRMRVLLDSSSNLMAQRLRRSIQ